MEVLRGKTKCLNYFDVNNKLYLVDLPGYGFSKMSLSEKENINALTNYFLENTKNLKHIFLLLDIRHLPTSDDKMMYKWLYSHDIPFTIILNKADKLSNSKQTESLKMIEKDLFAKEELIPFSSETKQNLDKILTIIDSI